ncbi:hypothetical protein ACLBV4_22290, partial [Pseudomonas aeruginosa]
MIKSAEEIQRMSVAGALTAKVLEALDEVVRPGISVNLRNAVEPRPDDLLLLQ